MATAMSKLTETIATPPSQESAASPSQDAAAAPSQNGAQDLQPAAEEPRRRRRAIAERDDIRALTMKRLESLNLIGHFATKLPKYKVLQRLVTTTFLGAEPKGNPGMLSHGYFEMIFLSSHAKDDSLAASNYNLPGKVITLVSVVHGGKKPKFPKPKQIIRLQPGVVTECKCDNCDHTLSVLAKENGSFSVLSAETQQPPLVEPVRDGVANAVAVAYESLVKLAEGLHEQAAHTELISHIPTKLPKYNVAHI